MGRQDDVPVPPASRARQLDLEQGMFARPIEPWAYTRLLFPKPP